ncbi:MAG: ABC transporter permease [Geminicoccaceae bacterium]|nr:ABC transporter permease [Geminicoccaceae bacterium]
MACGAEKGWQRAIVTALGLLALWQAVVVVSGAPPYILPGPAGVLHTLVTRAPLILSHAWITASEILLGFAIGVAVGIASGLLLASFDGARRWLLPVLVMSQALPVFALAPVLVLWLGYGMGSKIAMAVLIIYFPVTAALHDGLRRCDREILDLARLLGATRLDTLRLIRIPAALPALGSGLRVAASVAPIGAVVGEWVGSSGGLGFLMLHANARMQIDLMFASLLVLAAMALALYLAVDRTARLMAPWQLETDLDNNMGIS